MPLFSLLKVSVENAEELMAQDFRDLSAPSNNEPEELLSLNTIIETQITDRSDVAISNLQTRSS